MFHHVGLSVSNFSRSREFYGMLAELLGGKQVFENKGPPHKHGNHVAAYAGPGFMFTLWEASAPRKTDRYEVGLHHLAFAAPSKQAVDELHQKLRHINAPILDAPAEYPYSPGYYAVYFEDPDGLKLEYVYTPPA